MNLFTNLPPQSASDAVKAAHAAKYKASKQADTETAEEPAKEDTAAIRARAAELLESAQKTAESINPWRRYRSLQATDPTAAGIYYRKNKAAIHACYNH